ncbi:MAG: hypothetical protein C0478_02460 [Planctomyces sp.]|nr:hypothetical protein [Planctomyces sp.]
MASSRPCRTGRIRASLGLFRWALLTPFRLTPTLITGSVLAAVQALLWQPVLATEPVANQPVSALSAMNPLVEPARLMTVPGRDPQLTSILQTGGVANPPVAGRVKYYLFQVQVIEVDDQGVQTVVASPRIQTAGTPAGFVTERPNGQRFEFSVSVSDSLSRTPGTTHDPVAVNDPSLALPPSPSGSSPAASTPGGLAGMPQQIGNRTEESDAMPRIGGGTFPGGVVNIDGPQVGGGRDGLPPLPSLPPPPASFSPNSQASPIATASPVPVESVLDRLSRKITVNFSNETRRSALRKVAQEAGVNIIIDPAVLVASRPALDVAINLDVADRPADEVIEQLVAAAELSYAVKHEVVLIGHAEQLRPKPEDYYVKTYPVAELAPMTNGQPDFIALVSEIQSNVQPKTWQGPSSGSIRVFQSTGALVVRQTEAGHHAVEKYLKKRAKE